jgi:hypothetical protein
MASNASSTRNASDWRAALGRFFRNPETGELAVAQLPNLPFVIFLVAAVTKRVLHPVDGVGTAVSLIAGVSIVWWALDEIIRGDSPFRRVLGGVVLVGSLLGFVMR